MASPQKEKGYTAIANEIMDAFGKTRIPGEARQVLDVVLRNTYGWNRKAAKLSINYLAQATGLKRPNVSRALNVLKKMNMIEGIKNDTSYINIFNFNKDFNKWRLLPKKIPPLKNDTTPSPKVIPVSVLQSDTQQSKDSKAKSNKATPSSQTTGMIDEVNLIFNCFYETINPQISFPRKDSRDAALWLINKYGFDNAYKAAKYACSVFEESYAPQIKTPAELKDKWANLVKYKNKQDAAPER